VRFQARRLLVVALVTIACSKSPDAPPAPESFPCGDGSCDPTTQYCSHSVDGLTMGKRFCEPLPSSCDGGASDCSCLPDGSAPFCYACRTVGTGSPIGLELDCPGPID
jgi:hypothetical protein